MQPTQRDLIHRDVKPANILITGEDHVYLTDFGLTKHASSISGLTRTGQWVGTVDYTAPEQIEGTSVTPADRRVLARLRVLRGPHGTGSVQAGERPRDALGARVLAAAVGARASRRTYRRAFDDVVQRAMAKDPAERYPSAGELGRAALAAARGHGGPAPSLRRRSSRRLRLATGSRRDSPSAVVRDRRLVFGLAGAAARDRRPRWRSCCSPDRTIRRPTRRRRDVGSVAGGRLLAPPALRCPPRARTWRARCSTGRSGSWAGSRAGSRARGTSRATTRSINGWKSAPDLPVRLHHEMVVTYKDELVVIGGWIPKGSDPSGEITDRVFALRGGQLGRAALAQRPARGGRRRGGRRSDRGRRRPGRWSPARHHRGVRRQEVEHRREDPDAARASGGGLGRATSSTRWADERCRPTRTLRRSSATTPPPTAGNDSPTCRTPAAGSEPRSRTAICSRSAARPRRAHWARRVLRPSHRKWSSAPSMRTPATESPWPRSTARSTRSAARRDPVTPAHRRLRRRSACCVPGSSQRPGAAWRRLPSMPTARQNMAGTVPTGRSGSWADSRAGSRARGSVEGYDPVINGWKSAPDLPVRLHHEMVVTYKDEMVVIGGWITEGIGSKRRDHRPRVRAARRTLGRAALAATARARRAPPRWSAIGSWSPAARPMVA